MRRGKNPKFKSTYSFFFLNFSQPSALIYLGASDLKNPLQRIIAAEFKPHPFFNTTTEANDIGLIRLSQPANLTLPQIKVVRLPRRGEVGSTFYNELTTAIGWGYTNRGSGHPVDKLHAVNETTITNLSCLTRYPAYINAENVCTSTGEGTPCEGDEGK